MISDDDVLRLFEQADPALQPDRTNDHVAGAGFLTALQQQRSIDMTITESPQTEPQSPRERRWALMGAAAAVAALVIGLVAVIARDTEPTAPAAPPPAPTASPSEVDIAERFYGALNDRDVATLQALMGSGAVYDGAPVEDLPAHTVALAAWDWEWDEVTCQTESVDADVRCEIAARNRLTELTGTELAGYSLLTMVDGKIDRVIVEVDFSDYSTNALVPFTTWLQDNHPEGYRTIFEGENDTFRQTTESAALLDQHLTEYINQVRSDADVVGSPDDGTEMVQLGGLDSQSLRPLASVSAGDVLIPTAPSGWYLGTTLYGDAENDDLPVSVFSIATDPSGRRSLELYLARACDANATSCPMADNGYQIGWPVADEMVLDGVAWGYPGGTPGEAVAAVIGDHVVAIAGTWYESRTPLLNDPDVLTLLEGLRVTSLAELPEQLRVVDEFGRPIDPITGELPAPPEKQAVASAEVRGTTLVLTAASVDDEICMSLDRADTGETVWPSGCFVPADVEETFAIDVAQLAAGPEFDELAPGEELEYLLVGYIDAPSAVDVRASYDGTSVGGRSAEPTDLLDGVFVLMSVNELDAVLDFEGGFSTGTIQLEVVEPSD